MLIIKIQSHASNEFVGKRRAYLIHTYDRLSGYWCWMCVQEKPTFNRLDIIHFYLINVRPLFRVCCVYFSFCGFTLTGSKRIKHAALALRVQALRKFMVKNNQTEILWRRLKQWNPLLIQWAPVLNVSFIPAEKAVFCNVHKYAIVHIDTVHDDGQGL